MKTTEVGEEKGNCTTYIPTREVFCFCFYLLKNALKSQEPTTSNGVREKEEEGIGVKRRALGGLHEQTINTVTQLTSVDPLHSGFTSLLTFKILLQVVTEACSIYPNAVLPKSV